MPINSPVHPAPSQLQAFRDGRLADGEARELDLHLAACAECQSALDSLSEDDLVLRCRKAGAAVSNATPLPPEPGALVSAVGSPPAMPADLAAHPRYLILGVLGGGGMGTVYMARHKVMNRVVALKVISNKLTNNPAAAERFRREVQAAAQLAHPNIVVAFDAERAGATHFLVMEFVEGVSLARLVEEGGPFPVPAACLCAAEAALGLQHAFEKGMVHRDVKPGNLMRTPDGKVKVLDFGLARFVSESRDPGELTQEGAVMGTPDFLAPEQARDAHAADIRADVYGLGCTLYFLLTGQPPFPGGSVVQKLAAHLGAAPRPLHKLNPEVPEGLSRVIERMLAKRPEDRFQTPAEVVEALTPFLRPQAVSSEESVRAETPPCPPQPAPLAPPPPRRRRWLPWAAAALLVLLGGAVYRIMCQ